LRGVNGAASAPAAGKFEGYISVMQFNVEEWEK